MKARNDRSVDLKKVDWVSDDEKDEIIRYIEESENISIAKPKKTKKPIKQEFEGNIDKEVVKWQESKNRDSSKRVSLNKKIIKKYVDEAVMKTLGNFSSTLSEEEMAKLTEESSVELSQLLKGKRPRVVDSKIEVVNRKNEKRIAEQAAEIHELQDTVENLKKTIANYDNDKLPTDDKDATNVRLEELAKGMQILLYNAGDDTVAQTQEKLVESLQDEIKQLKDQIDKMASDTAEDQAMMDDLIEETNKYKAKAKKFENRYTELVREQKQIADSFRNTVQDSYTKFIKASTTIWQEN